MPNPIKTVNLDFYKQDTYTHDFIYKIDGVVQNITGYTAILQIRDTSGNLLHTSSTTNGQITITGASGKVSLKIPGDTTKAWTFQSGQYDLFIVSGGGEEQALCKGSVVVYSNITEVP